MAILRPFDYGLESQVDPAECADEGRGGEEVTGDVACDDAAIRACRRARTHNLIKLASNLPRPNNAAGIDTDVVPKSILYG
jgi:hypothetical protein